MTQASINWKSLGYHPGDTLRAAIVVAGSGQRPPRSVRWTLFYNSAPVSSGSGSVVTVQNASHGVYKLEVELVDFEGSQSLVRSAVSVTGGTEARAVLPPPPFSGSLVQLGSVYSVELVGASGVPPSSPAQLAGLTQIVYLLPGTTHVSFALDPAQAATDGDVVVRTKAGNWALFGGTRLTTEDIGFGYRVDGEPVAAPADLKLQLTTEVYHVTGPSHGPFSVRVKVICWCQGPQLYRYDACPYAIHPGGAGGRQPRLAVLFQELELQLDAESTQDRFGSDQGPVVYTIPEALSIPGIRMAASGLPYLPDRATGLGFTEANRAVVYESPGLPDLDAHAVAGIPGIRPGLLSVQVGGLRPMVQRIKRLRGRLYLYANGAPLFAGTVVTVEIETGLGRSVVQVPVQATVYADEVDTFALAGSVAIDLEDFQFGQTGLVAHFALDEDASVPPVPAGSVVPGLGADYIYSTVYATTLNFDGVCYTNPQSVRLVQDIEAIAQPVTPVDGCQHSSCGPLGLYCYSNEEVQPEVSVVATDDSAAEGGGTGTFTFSRTGPTTSPLVVFFTLGGTAVNATDYQDLGSFVVFGVGASTAIKTVIPVDDAAIEALEWVTLSLSANGAYTLGSSSVATVYIEDNDVAPSPDPEVTVVASDANASESGDTGTFTFSRTGSTVEALTVNFTLAGSTATSGTDYATLGTSVTFAPGLATATKTVTPVDNAVVEGTETVILTLAAGTGYVVGNPSVATVYIVDDDENEPVNFTVTLEGGTVVDGWAEDTTIVNAVAYELTAFRAGWEFEYVFVDGSSGDSDPFNYPTAQGQAHYAGMLKDALSRASGYDVGTIYYLDAFGTPVVVPAGSQDPYMSTFDGFTSPTWTYATVGGRFAWPHTFWPNGSSYPPTGISMPTGWTAVVYGFLKSENTTLVPGRFDLGSKVVTGQQIVPGTPGVTYSGQFRVRGVVSLSKYNGGSNNGAYLQTGGAIQDNRQEIVKMTISDPPAVHYLNRAAARTPYNVPLDYTVNLTVKGGAVVTVELNNQDGFQYSAGADGLPVPLAGFPDSENVWIRLDITV